MRASKQHHTDAVLSLGVEKVRVGIPSLRSTSTQGCTKQSRDRSDQAHNIQTKFTTDGACTVHTHAHTHTQRTRAPTLCVLQHASSLLPVVGFTQTDHVGSRVSHPAQQPLLTAHIRLVVSTVPNVVSDDTVQKPNKKKSKKRTRRRTRENIRTRCWIIMGAGATAHHTTH